MKFETFDIKAQDLNFIMFKSFSSYFSFFASSSSSLMKLKNDSKSIFKEEISFKDTSQRIDD